MFERIDSIDWKDLGITRLFHDFLFAFDRVADLYPVAPFDLDGQQRVFEARQRYAEQHMPAGWQEVLEAWPVGAPFDPGDRVECLWLTGQQPGLMGGPLFTLYKMHTAARLAAFWRERGLAAGSAFWVLSEDHDLVEALRVFSIDHERPVTADLPPALKDDRRPIYRVPVTDPMVQAVVAFHRARVPGGMFLNEVLEALDHAYQNEGSLDQAFRRFLAQLHLVPPGMGTVPAHHDILKRAARELLQRLTASWPEIRAGWLEHTRRLEAAGYHAQIRIYDGYFPMFRIREGQRHRILYRENRFQVPETGESWSARAFQKWLQDHVSEISCNVALRPLVQDHVFPTLGYVAGASEIAYFAQLSYLYRVLGIPMPVLFPRLSLTLVPPRVQRRIKRFQLNLRDLLTVAVPEWRPAVQNRPAWWDQLERERHHWQELEAMLRGTIQGRHPALERALNRLGAGWERLQKVLERTWMEQDRAWAEARGLLEAYLKPMGSLQERVYHPAVFYATFGPALLEALHELDLFQPRHHIVAIH